LVGGWTTNFLFGWSLPIVPSITSLGNGRLVFGAALGPAVRDLTVDNLVLEVTLPAGAADVEVDVAVPGADHGIERRYSYVDFFGSPVVVIRMKNYVPEANNIIQIAYRPSYVAQMQRPLFLLAAAWILVLSVVLPFLMAPRVKKVNAKDKAS
jgi:oligosaccharyltransferase complex subunit alpha (ribophorin I)